MPDTQSVEFTPLVSHEQLNTAFWRAVRLFVGRGKRHRASEISVSAGIHRRTLDCYRGYPIGHPDHRPIDYDQMFSIASVVGADLTSEWIKLLGQGAFDLPDGEEGDLDAAAEDAAAFAGSVRRARSPKSPGGIAIVQEEIAEIIPLARRAATSTVGVAA